MLRVFQFALILFLIPAVTACVTPKGVRANSKDMAPESQPIQVAQNTQAKPAPSASSSDDSMNGISRAAAKAGVRTCLDSLDRAGNFLTANSQSKAIMYMPLADVDRQITSVSYEIRLQSNAIAYASLTTAPTSDGACDTLYETVAYWANDCSEVAAKGFPGTKQVGVVQQHIRVLQGKANLRIFLMPAGTDGCVAIKKEVIY